jgi:hypothetical protein
MPCISPGDAGRSKLATSLRRFALRPEQKDVCGYKPTDEDYTSDDSDYSPAIHFFPLVAREPSRF